MSPCGNGERGLPDQILFGSGNQVRIATGDANGKLVAHRKAALQIYLECDRERIEAGPEIGARSGHAQCDWGQTDIMP